MNPHALIARLEVNAPVIEGLLRFADTEASRWKPSPEKWSILEVVNHLYDEERDDFRTRLRLTLEEPETAWPGIDPRGWPLSRDYMSRELQSSIDAWVSERRASLAWLAGLREPRWENHHDHPGGFRLTAGDLLGSWVAHDYLHIRQIARIHHQLTAEAARPFSLEYAGPVA
jgi:hypothetical protein